MATGTSHAQLFLFLISLLSLISCIFSQEVCYPSVIRHRIDSIFPTTQLFCVLRTNDELEYEGVEVVQTLDQWETYSKNRELNRNVSVTCSPKFSQKFQDECTGNELLNAQNRFNKVFISRAENATEAQRVEIVSNVQLMQPTWNGSACYGILKSATLTFTANSSNLIFANVDLTYATLSETNLKSFLQTTNVLFVQPIKETSNETIFAGYNDGEIVYAVNGMVAVPLTIPALGDCFNSENIDVLFRRSISTSCTVRPQSCAEALSLARQFYGHVYPPEILSAPSDDSHPAIVHRANVSWDSVSDSGED
ncbi:unnamed protein product [Caenorhabditis auriculariae]|uniref:Tectonic domain-containing protein n=1 Tax=Caenorhabditis auriculariae TaxID=2777116 RepID=A0A8S1HV39_9PELO|nr:unnamed protein product [Caenorhabditis auriculariae]